MLDKLRNRKSKRTEESGNTIVLYVLWFPLLFSIFGLAIDTTAATYTNSTLQSALDTATQSALARADNPGLNSNSSTTPTLTSAQSAALIKTTYDNNRREKTGFLICQTAKTFSKNITAAEQLSATLVRPASGCNWTQISHKLVKGNGVLTVSMSIVEQSKPAFLQMLGVKSFTYNIKSEARVTFTNG